MACGGIVFTKNFKFNKKIRFHLLRLIFSSYFCSIELTRLRPDTSSLVVVVFGFVVLGFVSEMLF